MSIYQYQEPSALEKVSIRKSAGGGSRAFLFPSGTMSPVDAEVIRETLTKAHMSCVPSDVDGRHCLEVRGCKNIKTLEDALKPTGLIKGHALVDHSDNEKFSLREKFRNNLVSLYGVINIAADMGILSYGYMKQKLNPGEKGSGSDKAAGWSYFVGSSAFSLFGKGDKSDYQARDIALSLRKDFSERGLTLSSDSAAMSFSNNNRGVGLLKKSGGYLTKHGAEAGNIATGTAGAFMLHGALNSKQSSTKVMDGVLGATTMLSGYGAAVVKEKAPDWEHPPTTTLGKVKQWVQERPNRLAGYGYMVSTVIHGAETVRHMADAEKEHPGNAKYARKTYAMRGVFAVLNLVGEFILAAASKGHGSGVKGDTIEDTALAIVADAIVRQPAAKRDGLVQDLSHNFLTNPDVLGGDPAALEAKLAARVQKLGNNPWMNKSASPAPHGDVAATGAPSQTLWADQKVQKLVTEAAKAKPESYVSSLDKTRSAATERVL